MRELEQETNIEVLREFSGILLKTVDRLESTVTKLTREKLALAGQEVPEGPSQAWLNTELKDQLTRLKKKFFGFGRETLPGKPARPIGHAGQEVLALTAEAAGKAGAHSQGRHPEGVRSGARNRVKSA